MDSSLSNSHTATQHPAAVAELLQTDRGKCIQKRGTCNRYVVVTLRSERAKGHTIKTNGYPELTRGSTQCGCELQDESAKTTAWLSSTAKQLNTFWENDSSLVTKGNSQHFTEPKSSLAHVSISHYPEPDEPSLPYSILLLNTFAASYLNTQGLNNSCLKSPASALVDLTLQSRALRSFSLNQLSNLSL